MNVSDVGLGREAGECLGCSVDTQPRFLVEMGTNRTYRRG